MLLHPLKLVESIVLSRKNVKQPTPFWEVGWGWGDGVVVAEVERVECFQWSCGTP